MFEGMDSSKRPRPLSKQTKQGLLVWGALVVVLLPGAWLLWRTLNQRAARDTLQAVHEALAEYRELYGGYPDSLTRLRGAEKADTRRPQPEVALLLPTAVAKDLWESRGYRFRYQSTRRDYIWAATVPLSAFYQITAEPGSRFTGRWFYGLTEAGEIVEALSLKDLTEELQVARVAGEEETESPPEQ